MASKDILGTRSWFAVHGESNLLCISTTLELDMSIISYFSSMIAREERYNIMFDGDSDNSTICTHASQCYAEMEAFSSMIADDSDSVSLFSVC